MAKEITRDWEEQIKMKQRLECEQEENDRMYDYLWLKDAENKVNSYLIIIYQTFTKCYVTSLLNPHHLVHFPFRSR